jgi:protein-L-isoaspartate(D-aspartate) O-methyltransferase
MAGPPAAPEGGSGGAQDALAADSDPDAARTRMVDDLRDSGRLTSPEVEAAFRAVPRHVFLPEVAGAEAYQDRAFVIKTSDRGAPVSSSSQPAMMAIMLEQLQLGHGDQVLEVGTGTGYNAAVMARLVGERGSVVTVDIAEDLVARARANLAAARAGDVIVVCGDGGFGAPDYAPYDKIIVTAGAWDIAPAWLAQLRPGGRLVLPLSVRGGQLSVAFERGDRCWRSRSVSPCGFIPMTGAFRSPERYLPVGPQSGMYVRTDDGRPVDTEALHAALTGPAADVPAGVRVAGLGEMFEADLWVTVTMPDLVRVVITGMGLRGATPGGSRLLSEMPPFGAMARAAAAPVPAVPGAAAAPSWPRVTAGPSGAFAVAGLCPVVSPAAPAADRPSGDGHGEQPAEPAEEQRLIREYLHREFEVAVRGFGPGAAELAGRLAAQVVAWDKRGRPGSGDVSLAAYPPGAPVPDAAGQVILDRPHTRLALRWLL